MFAEKVVVARGRESTCTDTIAFGGISTLAISFPFGSSTVMLCPLPLVFVMVTP
jgi:hypothetical protein